MIVRKSIPRFTHFKDRVIEPARREINELTMFRMEYEYVKEGKSVVAIRFHMNMMYHTVT